MTMKDDEMIMLSLTVVFMEAESKTAKPSHGVMGRLTPEQYQQAFN